MLSLAEHYTCESTWTGEEHSSLKEKEGEEGQGKMYGEGASRRRVPESLLRPAEFFVRESAVWTSEWCMRCDMKHCMSEDKKR